MPRFPKAALAIAYWASRVSAARRTFRCRVSRPHCTSASETGLAAFIVASRSSSFPVSVTFSLGSPSLGMRPSTRAATSRTKRSLSCRHRANRIAQSRRFNVTVRASHPFGSVISAASAIATRSLTTSSKAKAVCNFKLPNTPRKGSKLNSSSTIAVRSRSQGVPGDHSQFPHGRLRQIAHEVTLCGFRPAAKCLR
jgi:hypothetical protein